MKKVIFSIVIFALGSFAYCQDLDALRLRCTNYGFQQGTDGFANCVQKLDAETGVKKNRESQASCQQALRQHEYYCSKKSSEIGNALRSFQCGEAESSVNRLCNK